jgi:hypothetical protein
MRGLIYLVGQRSLTPSIILSAVCTGRPDLPCVALQERVLLAKEKVETAY